METKPVELFERGNGWVASGNAEQWALTHELIEKHVDALAARWNRFQFDANVNLTAELARAEQLAKQAYDAIFRADQYGRLSIELFTNEAETIRNAIA